MIKYIFKLCFINVAFAIMIFANTFIKYENHKTFNKAPFLTSINAEHLTCNSFNSLICRVFQGLNNE
jgi:hypothetical protein